MTATFRSSGGKAEEGKGKGRWGGVFGLLNYHDDHGGEEVR